MKINHRIEFVDGSFETTTGELVCVKSQKNTSVRLCFKDNMNVPFAAIKLYSRDRYVDAKATFEDAARLGDEMAKRWNAVKEPAK